MENINDFVCHQPLVSKTLADFDLSRRLGFVKKIIVNNISGKDAWVILSPSPISSISTIGMEKVNVSFSHIGGEIKCQQFGIKNNNKKEYELDSSKIYYTVFFNCDGKWKCPYKDRKINANIYDINLLPKNVEESIDTDFVPK
jgi:hypothetical protein